MKGLLIKDSYTILKQMKFFLVFIFVFSCIPSFSTLIFAIVYSTMLPMTAIGYDERSKWDKLAAVMPYSASDIVLSKYVLGYIMVIATAVIACIAQAIVGLFTGTALTIEFFTKLVYIISFALIIEAIDLPVLIKFGVEKGRLFIILFTVITVVGGASLIENLTNELYLNINSGAVLALSVSAMLIISAFSAYISVKLYKSKVE